MVNNPTQQPLVDIWKLILPTCVQISCGNITHYNQLTTLENASIGVVDPLRLQEFSAGRKHAHLALAAIKLNAPNIPRCKESGKPIWPNGIIGSITHTSSKTHSHVAAVVANKNELRYLGIDAEIGLNLHPKLWQQFLTKEELTDLLTTPIQLRSNLVNKMWCLKESAIKASGVNDISRISLKAVDLTYEKYDVFVTGLENQLLMIGHGISVNGVTLATVYGT